jgi:uncharacterized protein YqjF (DUF2071 family)
MHQTWENLLFLHWPVSENAIRPLIPADLEIDTFHGQAWIGITPFEVSNLRLLSLPAMPGLESFLELNVRTYVRHRNVPGIWFLSLDASKFIPSVAARLFFSLPHSEAIMSFEKGDSAFRFCSTRLGAGSAQFDVAWQTGLELYSPDAESLGFFLVERYCCFATRQTRIETTRVYHAPWKLEEAVLQYYDSTMLSALGLSEPLGPPLAYFSRHLDVEIWTPAVTAQRPEASCG